MLTTQEAWDKLPQNFKDKVILTYINTGITPAALIIGMYVLNHTDGSAEIVKTELELILINETQAN